MVNSGLILTSWSSRAAELKSFERTQRALCAALGDVPRISTFDMSEKPWLTELVEKALKGGLIEHSGGEYPWHYFKLTDRGKRRCILYHSSLAIKERRLAESKNYLKRTRSRRLKTT